MNNWIIFIAIGSILVLILVIALLRIHYRKLIKEKERGIIRQIREQDRLAKELEYIRTEKKVMEKLLESKLTLVVMETELEENNK